MTDWRADIRFNEQGLIPAIAQDHQTGRVLMVAWMSRDALEQTIARREAVYWSRSRQKLWPKGEESGHTQKVHEIRLDCDGDVIVLQVEQHGQIACHTGRESCFYRVLTPEGWVTVDAVRKDPSAIYSPLANTVAPAPANDLAPFIPDSADLLTHLGDLMQARKAASPDSSYVASLYHKGLNKILEKVGEEATETILAAKDAGTLMETPAAQQALVYETADLWFHTLVMLGYFDIRPDEVLSELMRRLNVSGLAEKAARSPSP